MKKFFVLFLMSLMVASCSLDDDTNQNYHFEFIETLNAEFPEELYVGGSYEVNLYYTLPDDCYSITGIDYNYTSDYERVVALVATVSEGDNCQPNDTTTPLSDSFTFQPVTAGTYTFKFLSGVDEATNSYSYLTYQVEVLVQE